MAGIDILHSNHGPVVMEVNSSPGLEGIENATDVDIAGSIGVLRVMAHLGMIVSGKEKIAQMPSIEARSTKWVRASWSELLHLDTELGQSAAKKHCLGVIRDAFGDQSVKVIAPQSGIVIGHTQHPFVNRGDAIAHIASADNEQLSLPPEA